MDKPGGENMPETTQVIENESIIISAQGVEKKYAFGGGAVRVLRGLDLDVRRGEMIAIMGASGVGKSTLLHIFGALDRPTDGEVIFGGERLFGRSDSGLAQFRNRAIGFVFQFHHLLPEFSALENVMMPGLLGRDSRKEVKGRADALLERVGLKDRIHHRPSELSGGEQQRVAIARALVNKPELILADEPTGNLDSEAASSIFDLLREINRTDGVTFLVATHNAAIAERMDRLVIMVDGRIDAGV
jgi:lipoprotein-releasing system ATP-binding protein